MFHQEVKKAAALVEETQPIPESVKLLGIPETILSPEINYFLIARRSIRAIGS